MAPPVSTDRARRFLDLVLTIPLALLATPIVAIATLRIRREMGSPVLFRQERAGLGGKPFVLLKLRTMASLVESASQPQSDAARLTPLGRRLRASSIDEVPQLWNVLRGDMALVGPRPLPMAYVERYSDMHRRRLETRPGITGLAQVSGRNSLSWDDKFMLDVTYVDGRGVLLDLKILARTAKAVIRRQGISAEGHATMTEFMGARDDA